MSEVERKVIERSPEGGYQFTKYGEFLSYYHSHLQLFGKLIAESTKIPDSEKEEVTDNIKSFMKTHVKHVDHFFEHSQDFSSFLNITQDELTAFMNKNFLDVLHKVQDKLKVQEIEKISKSNSFSGITEEIVAMIGEIFPPESRFILQEGLIVIENLSTGVLMKPKGLLSEIQDARAKDEEKKKQIQQQLQKNRERNIETFNEDAGILQLLVEKFGTISAKPLELKPEVIEVKAQRIVEPETKKVKGLLDDVEDLDIEFHPDPEKEEEEQEPTYEEEEEGAEPGLLDDIEEKYSQPKEEGPEDDLANFLDAIESGQPEEEVVEEPKPDEADLFLYKQFAEITKIIQVFKAKNDVAGYNAWVARAKPIEKCFNAIRTNIAKEAQGQKLDWAGFYKSMQDKTGLDTEVLEKLKRKIVHLDKVKAILDICIQQLKKQPPEVVQLLKTGWPHILESFGAAPDYQEVENKVDAVLKKINNNAQRQPIEKILKQAIQKLKTFPV